MRIKRKIFFLTSLISLHLLSAPALAKEIVIGLSPFYRASESKQQIKTVLGFLAKNSSHGDSSRFFDAYHLKVLGNFKVPDKKIYRHPKARLAANKKLIVTLMQFAKSAKEPSGALKPSVIGAVRLPQFLRVVAQQIPGQDTDILILGHPLYDDPKDRKFSMAGGLSPNDGHIQVSRSDSPFGLKEAGKNLNGLRIHYVFGNEDWAINDAHQFHVHRFWNLFIAEQGGTLATFSGDLATALENVRAKPAVPEQSYKLQSTDKLEMIRFRPPELISRLPLHERPLSARRMSAERIRKAKKVEVGISWSCASCDLDLYARSDTNTKPLYFHNTKTSEGIYWKDFTSAPNLSHGLERIAFNGAVDLRKLLLAVNFYGGNSSGGVRGEIRLAVDQNTYALPFRISAKTGNGGSGMQQMLRTGEAPSSHWLVIDPLTIIGITLPTGKTQ